MRTRLPFQKLRSDSVPRRFVLERQTGNCDAALLPSIDACCCCPSLSVTAYLRSAAHRLRLRFTQRESGNRHQRTKAALPTDPAVCAWCSILDWRV
eukprot:6213123-Pleurochrysis_carterae.AAC.1